MLRALEGFPTLLKSELFLLLFEYVASSASCFHFLWNVLFWAIWRASSFSSLKSEFRCHILKEHVLEVTPSKTCFCPVLLMGSSLYLALSSIQLFISVLSLSYIRMQVHKGRNLAPLLPQSTQNLLHNRCSITTCWMNKYNYPVIVSPA